MQHDTESIGVQAVADGAPEWIVVCDIDDIPMLGARIVRRRSGGDIALFRTEGDAVFALDDRCAHKGGPLSQGIVHGDRVACPLHGWNFSLDTGEAAAPDVGRTPTWAVRIDGCRVMLDARRLRATA